MTKSFLIGLLTLFSVAVAASGSAALDKAETDLSDKASLQRGVRLFMNYCFGCHSTQYQRYNRVAEDLGIPIELMEKHFIFTGVQSGELMKNAMDPVDAERWFGVAPPDLTLAARVRGADWIYTFLGSFYADESRPFGVNNLVYPDVGMPHVLEVLRGFPGLVVKESAASDTSGEEPMALISDANDELSEDEYEQVSLDLVNYLVYSAEPVQLERKRLGFWVLGFLVILFIVSYLLKKEYWRDIH